MATDDLAGSFRILKHCYIRPQNGLALCKNAHWAFDADCRVIVASYRLSESGPESLKLAPYGGRLLQFAEGTNMRPKMDFFRAHRRHHGLAE